MPSTAYARWSLTSRYCSLAGVSRPVVSEHQATSGASTATDELVIRLVADDVRSVCEIKTVHFCNSMHFP